MAPKKSKTTKKAAEEELVKPSWARGWSRSTLRKKNLEDLVADDLLQDEQTAGWRPAYQEEYPTPSTDELVVFEAFFRCGLGIPVHSFLHELLEYYQITLCNLNLNSMLHIAVFIHFCETYLGIEPHFDLFWHFFRLKINGSGTSNVVGSVYLQLRDGMADKYIAMPLQSKAMEYKTKWFYIHQEAPRPPCDPASVPVALTTWSDRPGSTEIEQVNELLRLIDRRSVDGVAVAWNFISRRCQPCKERVHPAYKYAGTTTVRGRRQSRSRREARMRLESLFDLNKRQDTRRPRRSYCLAYPPPQINGQDRDVYFSLVPSEAWPKGVDQRRQDSKLMVKVAMFYAQEPIPM